VSRLQEDHNRLILEAIASGRPVTQRSLARQAGVALGLTNLLIRRLVGKGYVTLAKASSRHVRYMMTAQGWEALARATRDSLENTVRLYTATRDQIRMTLDTVSRQCPVDAAGQKRIIFYGATDVAEIAFVSLQATDLALVGVVDEDRTGRFFALDIATPDRLTDTALAGVAYSHVVITNLTHVDHIRRDLAMRDISAQRISCV
jgi:DNA-binding MarR family transcriptional regulator